MSESTDRQVEATERLRRNINAWLTAFTLVGVAVGLALVLPSGVNVDRLRCLALMARVEVVDLGYQSPSPDGADRACDYAAAHGYEVTEQTAEDIYTEWLVSAIVHQPDPSRALPPE